MDWKPFRGSRDLSFPTKPWALLTWVERCVAYQGPFWHSLAHTSSKGLCNPFGKSGFCRWGGKAELGFKMGQILKPWTNIFECDTNHLVLPEAFIIYLGKHWKIFFRATFGAAAIALEITVHPLANLRWSLVLSIGVAYLNSLCKPCPS